MADRDASCQRQRARRVRRDSEQALSIMGGGILYVKNYGNCGGRLAD